ncbi:hypothetical protein NC652_033040 [Populus alba x Populus x berolinensis]|nr:hypothetical protein NC652_033035 [Populus alba x Populus x berolinensis]KAJ6879616.1 hypothetical protein NC652_033040 [Populus alba x Populus x berolinensis]
MDDEYKLRGCLRRKSQWITNLYHFCYELFNNIIDMQLTELDDRFIEMSTELLLCVTCLNPSDSFSAFNKEKLLRLALFYPSEFSIVDLMVLGDQLDTYIIDLRGDDEFFGLVQVERIVGLDSPWAALSFGGQPNKDGGSYLENKGWTHTPPRQLPTCRLNQLTRVDDG